MPADVTWRRSADAAYVEDDRRVALLDLAHLDRPPVILEGSSVAVWNVLSEPRGEASILAEVARQFAVDSEEVRTQVIAFLRDLAAAGLITPTIEA